MTSAPWSAAQRMPSASAPPLVSRACLRAGSVDSRMTRTGRILASGAMPSTPDSLPAPWPWPAMMPAMAVPCRAQSRLPWPAPKPMRSLPGSTCPARSGWLPSTPVSRTATVMPLPLVVRHACCGVHGGRAPTGGRGCRRRAPGPRPSSRVSAAAAARAPVRRGRAGRARSRMAWSSVRAPGSAAAFLRRPRSTLSAMPLASWPRPASAAGPLAPSAVACSADWGVVTGAAVGEAGDGGDDDGRVGEDPHRPARALLVAEAGGHGALDGVGARHQIGAVAELLGGEPVRQGGHRGGVGLGEDQADGGDAAGGRVGVGGAHHAGAADRFEHLEEQGVERARAVAVGGDADRVQSRSAPPGPAPVPRMVRGKRVSTGTLCHRSRAAV